MSVEISDVDHSDLAALLARGPLRASGAAVMCESLAAALPDASAKLRAEAALAVYWVPITHPMRDPEDKVFAMARAIEHGSPDASAEKLRAFAIELRAGEPAMFRSWWATLHGGER